MKFQFSKISKAFNTNKKNLFQKFALIYYPPNSNITNYIFVKKISAALLNFAKDPSFNRRIKLQDSSI